MKTSAAVFAALALLVAPLAAAEQDASIHLRVSSHHKFYVTPMGHQCAYNNCVDPSVYPCEDGTCVRLNYTYGVCDTDSAAGSDDRPENEKFPCPFPNPYADVGSDDEDSYDVGSDEDSADSDSYYDDSDSFYADSEDVGAEADEDDEDAKDEDDQ